MREENIKCKNCGGEIEYVKPFGWRHTVATGCVKPQVDGKTWRKFLKNLISKNN